MTELEPVGAPQISDELKRYLAIRSLFSGGLVGLGDAQGVGESALTRSPRAGRTGGKWMNRGGGSRLRSDHHMWDGGILGRLHRGLFPDMYGARGRAPIQPTPLTAPDYPNYNLPNQGLFS